MVEVNFEFIELLEITLCYIRDINKCPRFSKLLKLANVNIVLRQRFPSNMAFIGGFVLPLTKQLE